MDGLDIVMVITIILFASLGVGFFQTEGFKQKQSGSARPRGREAKPIILTNKGNIDVPL